ncbi:MAG: hypothetical protein Q8P26_00305 [Candidatus Levybacteria bacterium]|nr:hypothetical protein [Candidatus Levybacteria bacterium]
MDSHKSGNNFFSGFLIGAICGAAIVFLLGTKKGKKLLKAISEEGSENVSNILEKLDKSLNLQNKLSDDEEEEGDSKKDVVVISEKHFNEQSKPKVRRFFRGTSRHFN